MSGCVRNIRTKNYQNLIIGFQVTFENVGDVFFGTQCIYARTVIKILYRSCKDADDNMQKGDWSIVRRATGPKLAITRSAIARDRYS